MKKTYLLFIAALIVSLFLYFTHTQEENSEVALAVVVGKHANAMEIPLNAASLKEAIYNSCYTYGNISFVSVDGEPKVYYQADIPKPEVGGLTSSKKKAIADGYTQQLLIELAKVKPVVPEVDTLKSIQKASSTLAGSSENADKIMVIMDSGLATKGYLDFTKGMLDADKDSIVAALDEAKAIPNMEDIEVIWMFNGQTAAPQLELSERQKHNLQEIWEAILLAGGAKSIKFASDISSEVSNENFPEVSLIDVENRGVIVEQKKTDSVELVVEKVIETIVLDNSNVQFIGDTAVFVDKEAAMEKLRVVANQLLSHPDNKVYIIGTTASGEQEFCKQLSIDRAEKVTGVLKELGVSNEQLIPMGLGFEDPWHIVDCDANGSQIEELACQNRKVMIVDVNGQDAELINKGE